jgi:Ca2+-binding EF-hand superfamily protein
MKGGLHEGLVKEVQVTSVSSLGSAISQYQSPLSSLDKNGDGVISADELAAANVTSKSSTASSSSSKDDDTANIAQKIAADIMSIMLQMQKADDSDNSDDQDSDGNSKGVLATLDANGDGKLTSSEILSADPSSIAGSASGEDSSVLTQALTDMQKAIQAYQTYGSSETTDTATDEIQTA